MRGILILAAVLSMTACTTSGDENPTVTYRYSGDLYGLRFEEVSEEASAYCVEQFDGKAQLQEADANGDENSAVFECI